MLFMLNGELVVGRMVLLVLFCGSFWLVSCRWIVVRLVCGVMMVVLLLVNVYGVLFVCSVWVMVVVFFWFSFVYNML